MKTYVILLDTEFKDNDLPATQSARNEFVNAAMGTVRDRFTGKFDALVKEGKLEDDLMILNVMKNIGVVVIGASDAGLKALQAAKFPEVTTIADNNADITIQKPGPRP